MTDIVKYIRACLYETYYVGIPGLGSFVGTYAPAGIDTATGNIRPPRKKIAFNAKIKLNDGYLVSMIASGEQMSPAEAEMSVVRFAEQLNAELKTKGYKELDGLGRFYVENDRLCFDVDERQNFLNESFALADIRLTPVERSLHFKKLKHSQGMETPETPLSAQPVARPAGKKPLKKKSAKKEKAPGGGVHPALYVVPLLLLAVICGLGSYLYTRDEVSQGSFNPADWDWSAISGKKTLVIPEEEMNELGTEEEAVNEESNDETGFADSNTEENTEPVSENNSFEDNATASVSPGFGSSSSSMVAEKLNRCYIIVGSFNDQSHAEELKAKLESDGKQTKLIAPFAPKNLYRVSVADFDNLKTAVSTMEQMRSEFGDAIWVLVY